MPFSTVQLVANLAGFLLTEMPDGKYFYIPKWAVSEPNPAHLGLTFDSLSEVVVCLKEWCERLASFDVL